MTLSFKKDLYIYDEDMKYSATFKKACLNLLFPQIKPLSFDMPVRCQSMHIEARQLLKRKVETSSNMLA